MAGAEDAFHVAQTGRSATGAGAADGDKAETLDGAGYELAIEALGDEDGDVAVAKAPGTRQQRTMPEDVDGGGGIGVAGGGAFVDYVGITKRDAEAANDEARQTWNDGEGEALLGGEGWHGLSLPKTKV